MAKRKVYWLGHLDPLCNLCARKFDGVMFDCTLGSGPWANICRSCYLGQGCKLGVGLGQEYHKQDDGRWLKVRG